MKKTIIVLVGLVSGFLTPSASFAQWDDLVTCNNKSMIVQVNSEDRTKLQFLSVNADANAHLFRDLGASSDFMSGNKYGVQGIQPKGVFTATDFQGATKSYDWTRNTYASLKNGDYVLGYREFFSFLRVENDNSKIKVQITRNDITKCVDRLYDGRFGKCAKGTYKVAYEYVGDWVFTDCQ